MDVLDESEIALDKSIQNLDSENGYDSDEGSSVKCSTAHNLNAPRRLPYVSDDGLSSICESVTSVKDQSFLQLLNDGPSFWRFNAFVKEKGCANNLKFWVVCERFRKLGAGRGSTSAHVRDEAKAVYHSYLKSTAPNKVAVKDSTVSQIKLSIDLRKAVNLQQLFANAQKEVFDLMLENEYQQFLIQAGDFSECSSQFANDILPAEGYLSDGSSLTGFKVIPRVPHTSRGGSAVHSDVESTSIASHSDSEPGSLFQPHRMLAPPRRVNRHQPSTCSDGEYTTRKSKQPTAETISEQFLRKVSDRLTGIIQDREGMLEAVKDKATRRGQKAFEVQKLEWYDYPSCRKYVQAENESSPSLPTNLSNTSPQESATLRSPNGQHIDSLANAELSKAMQRMEVCRIRIQHPSEMHKSSAVSLPGNDSGLSVSDSGRPSSQYSSSRLSESTTMLRDSSNSEESGGTILPIMNSQTDSGLDHSGLSDPSLHMARLYEPGLPEPSPHVARYIQQQNECSDRDKAAVAAASMIIENTPQLEQPIVLRSRPTRQYMNHSRLNHFKQQANSRLSISDVDTYGEDSDFSHCQSDSVCEWVSKQQHYQPPKIIRNPQRSEESSSDFTMMSSAFFVPRGAPYHPCSDSEDPRYPMSHKLMHRPKTITDRNRRSGGSSRSTGTAATMTPAGSSGSSTNTSKDSFAVKPGEKSIPVFYQVEGEGTPYRRMVADKEYTLMEFKKLFGKKGDYRFFFKSWCEEIQGEIKDELIDDHDVIPKYQNKIFAFIEKSS